MTSQHTETSGSNRSTTTHLFLQELSLTVKLVQGREIIDTRSGKRHIFLMCACASTVSCAKMSLLLGCDIRRKVRTKHEMKRSVLAAISGCCSSTPTRISEPLKAENRKERGVLYLLWRAVIRRDTNAQLGRMSCHFGWVCVCVCDVFPGLTVNLFPA